LGTDEGENMNNLYFPDLVKRHFEFLLAKNRFSITSETYTGFPLAEWIVNLCADELCIRVSIDKSQVFIDIGLPGKDMEWLDLMYVMMYISKDHKWKYLWPSGAINEQYYDKQLAHLSGILKEYQEQIKRQVINIANDRDEKRRFEKFIRAHSK
jgi:hypothetical protein